MMLKYIPPNVLTLARIYASVHVVAILLGMHWLGYQYPFQSIVILGLMAALMDRLDGWAARKLNAHTSFGYWIDVASDATITGALSIAVMLAAATTTGWFLKVQVGLVSAWISSWLSCLLMARGQVRIGERSFDVLHKVSLGCTVLALPLMLMEKGRILPFPWHEILVGGGAGLLIAAFSFKIAHQVLDLRHLHSHPK